MKPSRLQLIFDPRGTKTAFLLLSMAAQVAWVLAFFSIIDSLVLRMGESLNGVDTTLMLGIFLGEAVIGYFISSLAKDRRGMTYGVYGGLAALLVIVLMTWRSGLLALLVGLMAVLGGYNGGFLAEMMRISRQRQQQGRR
jgi:hypothetical protein